MTTDDHSLIGARHTAARCRLDLILGAYETFCAYSCMPETWRALAMELSIYLESEDVARRSSAAVALFPSIEPFRSYLTKPENFDRGQHLGYFVNDFVTALFHVDGVLAPTHHFGRDPKTLAFNVIPWNTDRVSQEQKRVRQRLCQVSMHEIYLPLQAIATHLLQNSVERQFNDLWSPCQDSHHDSLYFLALYYVQPNLRQPPALQPPAMKRTPSTLLRRAARAAGLLGTRVADRTFAPIEENETMNFHDSLPTDAAGRFSRNSKRSSYSDYESFITALTHLTGSSKSIYQMLTEDHQSLLTNVSINKPSTRQSLLSWPASGTQSEDVTKISQWASILKQRDIIPDPELENWSLGRGQHAEYLSDERSLIPLTVRNELGRTSGALVESVRCLRVLLVRKVVRCNKITKLKYEEAVMEVQQLYRAQHSHVVRLVGTYVIDDQLAILTYPCADWNLEQFLAIVRTVQIAKERTRAIMKFFTCLAKALDFLHSFPIKHMDIKPQNILVRSIRHSSINGSDPFKIYFTDFGSSRLYPTVEDSETDSSIPFTRTYAAPEVVLQERRGLSADIYSMGCVFTEMLATALDSSTHSVRDEGDLTCFQQLLQARSGSDGTPKPYFSQLDSVCEWLQSLLIPDMELHAVRYWTVKMLDKDPASRPTARQIADDPDMPSPCLSCITRPGPEAFEAAVPSGPWDVLEESKEKDDVT